MLSFSDINRDPGPAELRGLRLVLLVGGALVGLLLTFVARRPASAAACGATIAALLLLSFVPVLARFVYVGWMGLGVALGKITGPVLLAVVWVALFVPLALVMRLLGRDALARRRHDAAAKSFWIRHEPRVDVKDYFRQF